MPFYWLIPKKQEKGGALRILGSIKKNFCIMPGAGGRAGAQLFYPGQDGKSCGMW